MTFTIIKILNQHRKVYSCNLSNDQMKIRILTNEANFMGEKPFMVKTDLELDLKLEISDKLDKTMSV